MTGKRFEVAVAIVLGFDTEAEAESAGEELRALGVAVAESRKATGGIIGSVRENGNPASVRASRSVLN